MTTPMELNLVDEFRNFLPRYELLLAKLSPLNFEKKNITYGALLFHHEKQMEFYKSLKNNSIDTNQIILAIDDYFHFLLMHKFNPLSFIFPTLKEDLIWHSHMQNNQSYLLTTQDIIGKPLDHIFHIDLSHHKDISDKIRDDYNSSHRPLLLSLSVKSSDDDFFGCG